MSGDFENNGIHCQRQYAVGGRKLFQHYLLITRLSIMEPYIKLHAKRGNIMQYYYCSVQLQSSKEITLIVPSLRTQTD